MADPQHADMLAAWNEPRRGANQCEHGHHYRACPFCERDREIADLRIELANLRAADIHSCGPTCTRAGCVNGRLRESIAEALRLLGTEPQSARAVLLDAVRADARTLQARVAGLEADALRYRWLREGCCDKGTAASRIAQHAYGMDWDAAIDAARKGAA